MYGQTRYNTVANYGPPRIDGMSRDEVCLEYQERIALLARRLSARLPAGSALTGEDLISFGVIGLLEAIDRYDETRNIKFGTFAEYRIRGAMIDAMRATDTVSRHRRDVARRIDEADRVITAELGRPGTHSELAEHLEMPLETYWRARTRATPITHVSIDDGNDQTGSGGRDGLLAAVVGHSGDRAFKGIVHEQSKQALKVAISQLPERKRDCILLYYGRDLSLAEIAEVFDVTSSRVCQVLGEAKKQLRESLRDVMNLDDFGSEIEMVEAI